MMVMLDQLEEEAVSVMVEEEELVVEEEELVEEEEELVEVSVVTWSRTPTLTTTINQKQQEKKTTTTDRAVCRIACVLSS